MATLPAYDDATMVRRFGDWPSWPFLPLKRRNHSLEDKNLGVLLATAAHEAAVKGVEGAAFRVYHCYMFDPPKTKAEWEAAPHTDYPTVAALLQDGWVVD